MSDEYGTTVELPLPEPNYAVTLLIQRERIDNLVREKGTTLGELDCAFKEAQDALTKARENEIKRFATGLRAEIGQITDDEIEGTLVEASYIVARDPAEDAVRLLMDAITASFARRRRKFRAAS